ncbi:hypothetical protein ACTA71_003805 [Dictyostelium dimigraforme]
MTIIRNDDGSNNQYISMPSNSSQLHFNTYANHTKALVCLLEIILVMSNKAINMEILFLALTLFNQLLNISFLVFNLIREYQYWFCHSISSTAALCINLNKDTFVLIRKLKTTKMASKSPKLVATMVSSGYQIYSFLKNQISNFGNLSNHSTTSKVGGNPIDSTLLEICSNTSKTRETYTSKYGITSIILFR